MTGATCSGMNRRAPMMLSSAWPGWSQKRSGRPRIAVADADALWLRVLCGLRLTRWRPTLQLYTTAASLLDEAAGSGSPPWDAVLISLGLPDLHQARLIAELRGRFPSLCVAVTLPVEESHTLLSAICAGADGYVVKDRTLPELTATLNLLLGGCPTFGPALAECLLSLIADLSRNMAARQALPPRLGFSLDEYRFLQLLACGDSAVTAAERLQLADGSATGALRMIFRRLQAPQLSTVVPVALRTSFARKLGQSAGSLPLELPLL